MTRYRTIAYRLNRSFTRVYDYLGLRGDFFEYDWDNLIILDGCRYDTFSSVAEIDAQVKKSPASHTYEFLTKVTSGPPLDDAVWVSGNPQIGKFQDSIYKIVPVWEDGWDDDLNTVPPQNIIESTRKALDDHPNKRIIAHFIQPHFPFIGEYAEENLPNHSSFTVDGYKSDNRELENIWALLREGGVSKSSVQRAYRENLEIVLPQAQLLAKELEGKSVITSDHGNGFGERAFPAPIKIYGHPPGFHDSFLTNVPWVKYDTGSRRKIRSGRMLDSGNSTDTIESRLEDLGYK